MENLQILKLIWLLNLSLLYFELTHCVNTCRIKERYRRTEDFIKKNIKKYTVIYEILMILLSK